MKHATLALLLALTLAVGLSGCGRRDSNGGSDDILGNNSTENGGSVDNGTNSGMNGNTNNGTANGGTNSDTNNGTNSNTDGEGLLQGRSYQEMLEDGRVHDSDGYLRDEENSVGR